MLLNIFYFLMIVSFSRNTHVGSEGGGPAFSFSNPFTLGTTRTC